MTPRDVTDYTTGACDCSRCTAKRREVLLNVGDWLPEPGARKGEDWWTRATVAFGDGDLKGWTLLLLALFAITGAIAGLALVGVI